MLSKTQQISLIFSTQTRLSPHISNDFNEIVNLSRSSKRWQEKKEENYESNRQKKMNHNFFIHIFFFDLDDGASWYETSSHNLYAEKSVLALMISLSFWLLYPIKQTINKVILIWSLGSSQWLKTFFGSTLFMNGAVEFIY